MSSGIAVQPVRQEPIHRVGVQLPEGITSSAEAIEICKLDWEVKLRQAYFHGPQGKLTPVEPESYSVMRTSDGQPLGLVGKSFEPLQNREAFAGFDGWAKHGDLTYVAGGQVQGGKRVFIQARLGEDYLVGGVDPVRPYALLYNGHDGTKALTVLMTPTRLSCANQLAATLAKADTKVVIRHTKTIHERLAKCGEALGITQHRIADMFHAFDVMAQSAGTQALAEQVAEIIVPTPASGASDLLRERFQKERLELWRQLEGGSPTVASAGGRDTKWGLFNLATEWIDHLEVRKNDNDEKRILYSIEGFGAGHRQRVFDLLSV